MRPPLAIAMVAALALAGCSGPSPPAGGVSADGLSGTVLMEDVRFEPANLTVRAGAHVTWRNVGNLSHTVTSDDPRGLLNSGSVPPDARTERTFPTPGVYTYHCVPHSYRNETTGAREGMIGVVRVVA